MSEVLSLDIWQWLAGPQAHELVERAAATAPTDVAGIERLRRLAAPERVRAAMLLAQARGKARDKWPAQVAARISADPEGVEMASSARAAAYKAQRLREGLSRSGVIGRSREPLVLDLCSGIGGDAMALAQCSDFRVVAVDRDPVRAWMAGLNAGCDSLVRGLDETAGALANLPDAAAVHLDPARRRGRSDGSRSRRIVSLADHEPPPHVWTAVLEELGSRSGATCRGRAFPAAIKLSPGVNIGELTRVLPERPLTLEYLSESGRLTQAVAWLGALADAPGRRRATMLARDRAVHSLTEVHDMPALDAVLNPDNERAMASGLAGLGGRWLYEADDAIERAGLLAPVGAPFGMRELSRGLGLLVGEAGAQSPWLTGFEVLLAVAWNPRRIKGALRGLDAGVVEVKTRGGAVDPDRLQMELRGAGSQTITLFVLRVGRKPVAVLTRRVAHGPSRHDL